MASLRVKQFYRGQVTAPSGLVVYTVPTGKRDVLRSINVYNEASSSNSVTVLIVGFQTIAAWVLAAAPDQRNYQPWIVLNDGDQIKVFTSTGKAASVILSGSELFV